jgi:small-conductance mechanosensitive channel
MKFWYCIIALALLCAGRPAFGQAVTPPPANPAAAAPAPAAAAPAPADPGAITPSQAQQTLDILQDDTKRAQLIQTLRTIIEAAPGVKAAPGETPKTVAAPKASPAPAPASPIRRDGLGRQLLAQLADWIDRVAVDLRGIARAVTDFPLLWRWLTHMVEDPASRESLLDTLGKMAAVVGCGLAAEWALGWVLGRPYRSLERHAPDCGVSDSDPAEPGAAADADATMPARSRRFGSTWHAVQRLPFAIAGLFLTLLPVAAFAALANLMTAVDPLRSSGNPRLAILAVVNAYAVLRTVMCVTRVIASHEHPRLALLRIGTENAAYIEVWVRRIALLALFGVALANVAGLMGLAQSASLALVKLVALVVHLCLVIVVLQCRRGIAGHLRARDAAHGPIAALRNRVADVWHYIAIVLIVGLWVVWAVQIQNGFTHLLQFVGLTIAVIILGRLLALVVLGTLDRVFHLQPGIIARYPGFEARANRYYPMLRGLIALVIWVLTLVALLETWGLDAFAWFGAGRPGDRLVSALVTIGVAGFVAIAIWESANAAMDQHLARLTREEQLRRVARVKTLLPIFRNLLLIGIVTVLGLTILNQIGVNVGPLLAGAGIVGIAIGFGSQKLVQDLITGLFLLLENAMQVGDWVTAGGLSGSVETLSIRTVRLRAGDGSLHIIPFSGVTSVTNTNRGVGNAAVSVNVALSEDPDRVGEALKAIAAEMRADPVFGPAMQSDLQLWGVDKVDASVMTIVGQIVCTDTGRWGVQREFNRRLKSRFQELGIKIANPTQTILLQSPSKAEESHRPAVTAPLNGEGQGSSATPDTPPPSALGHSE